MSVLKEFIDRWKVTYKYIISAEYAIDPSEFFAKRLNAAMDGAGTYDSDLVRIIVSRSEVKIISYHI